MMNCQKIAELKRVVELQKKIAEILVFAESFWRFATVVGNVRKTAENLGNFIKKNYRAKTAENFLEEILVNSKKN